MDLVAPGDFAALEAVPRHAESWASVDTGALDRSVIAPLVEHLDAVSRVAPSPPFLPAPKRAG